MTPGATLALFVQVVLAAVGAEVVAVATGVSAVSTADLPGSVGSWFGLLFLSAVGLLTGAVLTFAYAVAVVKPAGFLGHAVARRAFARGGGRSGAARPVAQLVALVLLSAFFALPLRDASGGAYLSWWLGLTAAGVLPLLLSHRFHARGADARARRRLTAELSGAVLALIVLTGLVLSARNGA
ncbi:hypothetical protein [Streptomyces sp. NPDC097619]|uniref:hypothetical protein n=1 Tax=Streptomyces sp. NPDC097619 TaxID=3157228 RepID=UPI003329F8B0